MVMSEHVVRDKLADLSMYIAIKQYVARLAVPRQKMVLDAVPIARPIPSRPSRQKAVQYRHKSEFAVLVTSASPNSLWDTSIMELRSAANSCTCNIAGDLMPARRLCPLLPASPCRIATTAAHNDLGDDLAETLPIRGLNTATAANSGSHVWSMPVSNIQVQVGMSRDI